MNARLPQAYRFLVVGLPYGPELLREAEHDLTEDYGVELEGPEAVVL